MPSLAADVRVLVFTTVFPSAARPVHGLFVAERIRHASRDADVRIVSPVPWYQGRPEGAQSADDIVRPRFFYVPGVLKALDGVFLFLSALPAVWRLRRQFDFDLIDAHFGYPDGFGAILLGLWFDRPVAVTLRGSELDVVRYRLRRAAMSWALRRAQRVITVSEELATLAGRLGVQPDRVRVIGNGVDTTRFRPMDRAETRRLLGVAEGARLAVTVGHLARVKGFHVLLRAVAGMPGGHETMQLVIVGGPAASSGTYPAELASEIARLGLADRVTITGSVPPDRVALWLNAANVFVLASEREGSPNALREAMACGCPVVVSDVGDARRVVGGHGLIVADRTDPECWRAALAAALGKSWNRTAIRAEAERHDWSHVAACVVSEWQTCMGRSGSRTVADEMGRRTDPKKTGSDREREHAE